MTQSTELDTGCKQCGACCSEWFIPPLDHMASPPLWVKAMLVRLVASDAGEDDEPCMFWTAGLDGGPSVCVIHDKPWRPALCKTFSCGGDCSGLEGVE